MSKKNENEEIKVILIGDSGVGKTNLINTSVGIEFSKIDSPTVSGSFISKIYTINDKQYIINLWDTAGQEAYKGITQLFFRDSQIVILVYDICSSVSFKSLENWFELCEDTINNEHIYGFVGNKNDLYLNAEVTENEGKEFAQSKNSKFKLVSAKEDPQSFIDFVEELIIEFKKIKKINRRQSIKINKSDMTIKNENNNNCKCSK